MEYLKSLKAQVLELQEKNSSLEASLSSEKEALQEPFQEIGSERTVVQVVEAPESSSESRRIELRVIVREEDCEMTDLLLRLLECLKQMQDVSLVSIDADTHLQETNQINRAIFRIQIKVLKTENDTTFILEIILETSACEGLSDQYCLVYCKGMIWCIVCTSKIKIHTFHRDKQSDSCDE